MHPQSIPLVLGLALCLPTSASAAPFFNISGSLVGTGSNGQGYTSRVLLDGDGDGEADTTVVIESPNETLSERIQDAIDNGFTDVTVIDSDNDGKLDADEEIVFEAP